jgi:hypothetical protein
MRWRQWLEWVEMGYCRSAGKLLSMSCIGKRTRGGRKPTEPIEPTDPTDEPTTEPTRVDTSWGRLRVWRSRQHWRLSKFTRGVWMTHQFHAWMSQVAHHFPWLFALGRCRRRGSRLAGFISSILVLMSLKPQGWHATLCATSG